MIKKYLFGSIVVLAEAVDVACYRTEIDQSQQNGHEICMLAHVTPSQRFYGLIHC